MHVRRCTLNITNLRTAYKRKDRPRLYHIVENDFTTTVTTKWKLGLRQHVKMNFKSL